MYDRSVFVWFEKSGNFLRYETRDLPEGGFQLCIIDVDGTERVERFDDSAALTRRQIDFERELSEKGWTGPHGWNL